MQVAIPYGAYWSTPFARWQGGLAQLHAVEFAAWTARRALAARGIDPARLRHGVLGLTVPQRHAFYGLPWFAGLLGAPAMAGPCIAQACATSARCLAAGAAAIALEGAEAVLVAAADRTSNGPHLYYPDPKAAGGTGAHEDWVPDNFAHDPHAGVAMIACGENVARRFAISTAEQHDMVLRRYAQYQDACANDRAFLRRFMSLPFEVPDRRLRHIESTLDGDEGITPTTEPGLARLRPVLAGGSITYGGQTHPADGNAGIILTTPAAAAAFSADARIGVRLLGFGQARAEPGFMPLAAVPAAQVAMARAGIGIADLAAVKTHNPFVVNDIVLLRETGLDPERLNNYGCSLVWGHPQGPTGLRTIIELIEELVLRGGGYGLFTGCAAGDVGMAVALRVG